MSRLKAVIMVRISGLQVRYILREAMILLQDIFEWVVNNITQEKIDDIIGAKST